MQERTPPDLAKLGHDLNNALMAIGSASYMLAEKLRGTAHDEGELDEIDAAVARAVRIGRSLLANGDRVNTPTSDLVPPIVRSAPSAPAMSVLLVEDEHTVRTVIRRVLTSSGFRVLEASDGQEALAVAEQAGPIGLLLSDVVMPRLSGPELAKRLRAQQPDLPVIYMTGYLSEVQRRGGLTPAEASIITKPFTPAALLARVRETLAAPRSRALALAPL